MDWIHCNNCFSQLEPGITLHLTSCGHMFCNNCLNSDGKESTCLVCRAPCSVMKLVPDMNPEIQDYFTDPEELIKKSCEVLQFQRQHRRRLLSYLLQSNACYWLEKRDFFRFASLAESSKATIPWPSLQPFLMSHWTQVFPHYSRRPGTGTYYTPLLQYGYLRRPLSYRR